jgi:hypothetical protein
VLAWLHETQRRDPTSVRRYFDCDGCMQTSTREQRQSIGCGWEPPRPPELGPPLIWDHTARVSSAKDRTTVCPGYSCGLPEVVEASHAHLHWSKGHLRDLTRTPPSKALLRGIEVLEIERGRVEDWALKNPPKES